MTDAQRIPSDVFPNDGVFQERLRRLREQFVDRARQDAERIRAARARADAGEALAGELLRDLLHTVHALSGAAGIFGFEAISDAAFRVERDLRRFEGPSPDVGRELDELERELAGLTPAV